MFLGTSDTLKRGNTGAGMLAQMINYAGISVQLINCSGPCEVYTLCNNTCRLSEIPLGAAAAGIQRSQGLSPLLPRPEVGTWFDSELFEELLALSCPPCFPPLSIFSQQG